jgi:protein CpxP
MTKRILVAAGLVAALAGGTAVSFAQPGRPGVDPGPRGPRGSGPGNLGLRGVQLTDAQREQVRSIVESHRAEFDNVGTALRQAHRAFAEATRAEGSDEATIRARAAAVGSAMADEAILRAKVRTEVHAVLTPEQQQQLKEREAAFEKRLQERGDRQQKRQRPPQ